MSERDDNLRIDRVWETVWCHDYTLVDGKVTNFREFTNTADVAAAFA